MKRLTAVVALAIGASMFLSPVANAQDPCSGTIGGDQGTPVIERGTIVDIGGAFYLDVRELAGPDQTFSIWLYQESNGVSGLQRGNDGADTEPFATLQTLYEGILGSSIDPCDDNGVGVPSDTVIF